MARLKMGSLRMMLARSLKMRPSSTRQSAPSSEMTSTVNSDGFSSNSARSPKCWCGRRVPKTTSSDDSDSSSFSSSLGLLMIRHSPFTKMYHRFVLSPWHTMTSPCLKDTLKKLCASSSFSCESKACKGSTWSNSLMTPSSFSLAVFRAIFRNAACVTLHTTEGSTATAKLELGKLYNSCSSPKVAPRVQTTTLLSVRSEVICPAELSPS
mmetsp:Transcript_46109/g.109713  ORF Transcript_46109/g.109713 Transcript_46109/m.109713 type:complete len:210 (+) Transcript_46109:1165-1794(+)